MKTKDSKFELSVTAELKNGKSINLPEFGASGLSYVEGRPGTHYSIKFRNNTPDRVLAVFSVDGLDVLDGKPCTAESRGYIVQGYSSCDITGWRTSLDNVAEFVFSKKKGAYSTKTGGTDLNCGVIAVKVFNEKQAVLSTPAILVQPYIPYVPYPINQAWPWSWTSGIGVCGCATSQKMDGAHASYYQNVDLSSVQASTMNCSTSVDTGYLSAKNATTDTATLNNATAVNTAVSNTADFNLGTAWGTIKQDAVTLSSFERGTEAATLTLYYSDAEGLKAAGIDVSKKVAVEKPLPQAFGGFCTPPKV